MRLIDADKLMEEIKLRIACYGRDCNSGAQRVANLYEYEIKRLVEKQPTAYCPYCGADMRKDGAE